MNSLAPRQRAEPREPRRNKGDVGDAARPAPLSRSPALAAAAMASDSGDDATYDLTPVVSKFLDGHLVLPLLDHLESRGTFPKQELQRAKLAVISKTNMLDFAILLCPFCVNV